MTKEPGRDVHGEAPCDRFSGEHASEVVSSHPQRFPCRIGGACVRDRLSEQGVHRTRCDQAVPVGAAALEKVRKGLTR